MDYQAFQHARKRGTPTTAVTAMASLHSSSFVSEAEGDQLVSPPSVVPTCFNLNIEGLGEGSHGVNDLSENTEVPVLSLNEEENTQSNVIRTEALDAISSPQVCIEDTLPMLAKGSEGVDFPLTAGEPPVGAAIADQSNNTGAGVAEEVGVEEAAQDTRGGNVSLEGECGGEEAAGDSNDGDEDYRALLLRVAELESSATCLRIQQAFQLRRAVGEASTLAYYITQRKKWEEEEEEERLKMGRVRPPHNEAHSAARLAIAPALTRDRLTEGRGPATARALQRAVASDAGVAATLLCLAHTKEQCERYQAEGLRGRLILEGLAATARSAMPAEWATIAKEMLQLFVPPSLDAQALGAAPHLGAGKPRCRKRSAGDSPTPDGNTHTHHHVLQSFTQSFRRLRYVSPTCQEALYALLHEMGQLDTSIQQLQRCCDSLATKCQAAQRELDALLLPCQEWRLLAAQATLCDNTTCLSAATLFLRHPAMVSNKRLRERLDELKVAFTALLMAQARRAMPSAPQGEQGPSFSFLHVADQVGTTAALEQEVADQEKLRERLTLELMFLRERLRAKREADYWGYTIGGKPYRDSSALHLRESVALRAISNQLLSDYYMQLEKLFPLSHSTLFCQGASEDAKPLDAGMVAQDGSLPEEATTPPAADADGRYTATPLSLQLMQLHAQVASQQQSLEALLAMNVGLAQFVYSVHTVRDFATEPSKAGSLADALLARCGGGYGPRAAERREEHAEEAALLPSSSLNLLQNTMLERYRQHVVALQRVSQACLECLHLTVSQKEAERNASLALHLRVQHVFDSWQFTSVFGARPAAETPFAGALQRVVSWLEYAERLAPPCFSSQSEVGGGDALFAIPALPRNTQALQKRFAELYDAALSIQRAPWAAALEGCAAVREEIEWYAQYNMREVADCLSEARATERNLSQALAQVSQRKKAISLERQKATEIEKEIALVHTQRVSLQARIVALAAQLRKLQKEVAWKREVQNREIHAALQTSQNVPWPDDKASADRAASVAKVKETSGSEGEPLHSQFSGREEGEAPEPSVDVLEEEEEEGDRAHVQPHAGLALDDEGHEEWPDDELSFSRNSAENSEGRTTQVRQPAANFLDVWPLMRNDDGTLNASATEDDSSWIIGWNPRGLSVVVAGFLQAMPLQAAKQNLELVKQHLAAYPTPRGVPKYQSLQILGYIRTPMTYSMFAGCNSTADGLNTASLPSGISSVFQKLKVRLMRQSSDIWLELLKGPVLGEVWCCGYRVQPCQLHIIRCDPFKSYSVKPTVFSACALYGPAGVRQLMAGQRPVCLPGMQSNMEGILLPEVMMTESAPRMARRVRHTTHRADSSNVFLMTPKQRSVFLTDSLLTDVCFRTNLSQECDYVNAHATTASNPRSEDQSGSEYTSFESSIDSITLPGMSQFLSSTGLGHGDVVSKNPLPQSPPAGVPPRLNYPTSLDWGEMKAMLSMCCVGGNVQRVLQALHPMTMEAVEGMEQDKIAQGSMSVAATDSTGTPFPLLQVRMQEVKAPSAALPEQPGKIPGWKFVCSRLSAFPAKWRIFLHYWVMLLIRVCLAILKVMQPITRFSRLGEVIEQLLREFVNFLALMDGRTTSCGLHPVLPHKIESDTNLRRLCCINYLLRRLSDAALGACIAILLIVYGPIARFYAQYITRYLLFHIHMSYMDWFEGWPAGLKLNDDLNAALGFFAKGVLILWDRFLSSVYIPLFGLHGSEENYLWVLQMVDIPIYVSILGSSCMLALLADIVGLVTLHFGFLYGAMSLPYRFFKELLASLFNQFRGMKHNPLRNRTDAYVFSVDQMLMATFLLTIVVFLFPTIVVYYLYFAFVRTALLMMQAALAALGHLALYNFLFPLGYWFVYRHKYSGGVVFTKPIVTMTRKIHQAPHANGAAAAGQGGGNGANLNALYTTVELSIESIALPISTILSDFGVVFGFLPKIFTPLPVLSLILKGSVEPPENVFNDLIPHLRASCIDPPCTLIPEPIGLKD